MGGCKITKFVKVFSLESFPLYGSIVLHQYVKLNVHGTMTDSSESVLMASIVHVLSTMELFIDMQPAVALPPVALAEHTTTAKQNIGMHNNRSTWREGVYIETLSKFSCIVCLLANHYIIVVIFATPITSQVIWITEYQSKCFYLLLISRNHPSWPLHTNPLCEIRFNI